MSSHNEKRKDETFSVIKVQWLFKNTSVHGYLNNNSLVRLPIFVFLFLETGLAENYRLLVVRTHVIYLIIICD